MSKYALHAFMTFQLSKVNTITLIAWLKERGVTCKSRDKKTDLVQKVNTLLNIAEAEM